MNQRSLSIIFAIAGISGLLAAVWSGWGQGLGPVRGGVVAPFTSETRTIIMILTFIGAFGAFGVMALSKSASNKALGISSLIFSAFFIPSLFQANILSFIAMILLFIAGLILFSARPSPDPVRKS
jgi:hypothetical protein